MAKKANYKITEFENMFHTKNYRKLAKTVTFTKIYGGGYKALMGWLAIDEATAKGIIRAYELTFPDIQEKTDEIIAQAAKDGYVTTPFGTRLSVDKWDVWKIVNHIIQHSAAMLLKMGMRKCVTYLNELDIGASLIMTVHDENIFAFREGTATKRRLRKLCSIMSDHEGIFSVPTPVDIDIITERWSRKEKVLL